MYFLLFISGLIVGSFLAALSYRLPRKISIKKGRSFCPECKVKISWYDNVPVLSYIILRGRCRHCSKMISWRYPAIELTTAISFVLIGLNPFMLLISCLLITIFVIDLEDQIIPDELVFIGLVAFILVSFIDPNRYPLFIGLLAGFLSALFLLFVNIVTKGQGMGLGDVKLVILLGAILGRDSINFMLLSFLTGGALAVILILTKKAGLKQKIAFGPFLIIGFLLSWIGIKVLPL